VKCIIFHAKQLRTSATQYISTNAVINPYLKAEASAAHEDGCRREKRHAYSTELKAMPKQPLVTALDAGDAARAVLVTATDRSTEALPLSRVTRVASLIGVISLLSLNSVLVL